MLTEINLEITNEKFESMKTGQPNDFKMALQLPIEAKIKKNYIDQIISKGRCNTLLGTWGGGKSQIIENLVSSLRNTNRVWGVSTCDIVGGAAVSNVFYAKLLLGLTNADGENVLDILKEVASLIEEECLDISQEANDSNLAFLLEILLDENLNKSGSHLIVGFERWIVTGTAISMRQAIGVENDSYKKFHPIDKNSVKNLFFKISKLISKFIGKPLFILDEYEHICSSRGKHEYFELTRDLIENRTTLYDLIIAITPEGAEEVTSHPALYQRMFGGDRDARHVEGVTLNLGNNLNREGFFEGLKAIHFHVLEEQTVIPPNNIEKLIGVEFLASYVNHYFETNKSIRQFIQSYINVVAELSCSREGTVGNYVDDIIAIHNSDSHNEVGDNDDNKHARSETEVNNLELTMEGLDSEMRELLLTEDIENNTHKKTPLHDGYVTHVEPDKVTEEIEFLDIDDDIEYSFDYDEDTESDLINIKDEGDHVVDEKVIKSSVLGKLFGKTKTINFDIDKLVSSISINSLSVKLSKLKSKGMDVSLSNKVDVKDLTLVKFKNIKGDEIYINSSEKSFIDIRFGKPSQVNNSAKNNFLLQVISIWIKYNIDRRGVSPKTVRAKIIEQALEYGISLSTIEIDLSTKDVFDAIDRTLALSRGDGILLYTKVSGAITSKYELKNHSNKSIGFV